MMSENVQRSRARAWQIAGGMAHRCNKQPILTFVLSKEEQRLVVMERFYKPCPRARPSIIRKRQTRENYPDVIKNPPVPKPTGSFLTFVRNEGDETILGIRLLLSCLATYSTQCHLNFAPPSRTLVTWRFFLISTQEEGIHSLKLTHLHLRSARLSDRTSF